MGIAGLNYKYTRKFGHGKIRIVLSMKIKVTLAFWKINFWLQSSPAINTKKGI